MVRVYFETKNGVAFSQLVATFQDEDMYMVCLPSLQVEAEKHGYIVTESVEADEVQYAKEVLTENGIYAGDYSFTTQDVKNHYDCTEDEAHEILESAMANEATMNQIWFAIHHHAQEQGLTKKED